MLQKILTSWRLVNASARVLRSNSGLLIFPIITAFFSLLVTATFGMSLLAIKGFDVRALLGTTYAFKALALFLFYLVEYTVIFFANTALVGAVMAILDGGRPTFGDGLRIARERVGAIVGYALIMATVGMIFRFLYRGGGVPGRLLGPFVRRAITFSLLGLAWHLVTYLVVPVLVVENIGPIEAVKRSSHLVKRTWGEQIVGNTSIWLIFSAPILVVVAVAVPLLTTAVRDANDLSTIVVLYAVIMFVVTLLLFQMALESIFSAVVYRYAADGQLAGPFDESLLRNAFRSRPSSLASRVRRMFGRDVKE